MGGFKEVEIKEAVWECEGSKSPGLNGYNFGFIKVFWETLKNDIVKAVHNFSRSKRLVRC